MKIFSVHLQMSEICLSWSPMSRHFLMILLYEDVPTRAISCGPLNLEKKGERKQFQVLGRSWGYVWMKLLNDWRLYIVIQVSNITFLFFEKKNIYLIPLIKLSINIKIFKNLYQQLVFLLIKLIYNFTFEFEDGKQMLLILILNLIRFVLACYRRKWICP